MSGIVGELNDQYIQEYQKEKKEQGELDKLMKIAEPSFSEWDNEKNAETITLKFDAHLVNNHFDKRIYIYSFL